MQELEKEIEGKIEETTEEESKKEEELKEEGEKKLAESEENKKVIHKVIKEEGEGDKVGDGKRISEKDSVEQKEKKLDKANEEKITLPKPQRPHFYNTPESPPLVPYSNPPPPINIPDSRVPVINAPLSPRSLAFVLENHQIIERRKRSPRRSYSRSPSPLYRRSRSRTPLSPKRRKPTPPLGRLRVSERRRKSPPKQRSRKRTLSRSPKPERQKTPLPPADPVLEARRKKFESSVLPTAGKFLLTTYINLCNNRTSLILTN